MPNELLITTKCNGSKGSAQSKISNQSFRADWNDGDSDAGTIYLPEGVLTLLDFKESVASNPGWAQFANVSTTATIRLYAISDVEYGSDPADFSTVYPGEAPLLPLSQGVTYAAKAFDDDGKLEIAVNSR